MIIWPLPKIEMGVWMPLLGSGVGVTFTPGDTLKRVLRNRLMIRREYLEQRIQTILVNSRAIDDPGRVYPAHGDVVALSAAMPGLVGTTLKRGSHLAAMRREITLNSLNRTQKDPPAGIITLKLFNMVAAELGPRILTGRIMLKREDLRYLRLHCRTLSLPEAEAGPDDWIEIHLPNPD